VNEWIDEWRQSHTCDFVFLFVVTQTHRRPTGPYTNACVVYDHAIAPGSGRQWSSIPPLPEGRSGGGLDYSRTLNALIYAGGAQRNLNYEDILHTWMYVLGSSAGCSSVRHARLPVDRPVSRQRYSPIH
jgi:hypothetical protein